MITLFEELLDRLVTDQVKFVVAGGLAVCLNGWVRVTDDVDILIDNSSANIERLTRCLADFGEGHGADLTPDDLTNEPGAVRICEEFILDLFVQMSGKTLAEFTPWIGHYRLPSGNEVPFLLPEGLIQTKLGSVRQKDKSDIAALQDILHARRTNKPPEDFTLDSVRSDQNPD